MLSLFENYILQIVRPFFTFVIIGHVEVVMKIAISTV